MSDISRLPFSEEEKELQDVLYKFERFPKLACWFQLFLDKQNKFGLNTWGNSTQSALHAYNLDSSDPKQYATACSIGSQNFRKLKVQTQIYYEMDGLTAGKVLDLIASKAITTNNAKYLIMLAELTGIYEQRPNIAVQTNMQVNNQHPVQISPEEQKELANEFEDFLDWKYGSPFSTKPTPHENKQIEKSTGESENSTTA